MFVLIKVEAGGAATTYQECAKGGDPQPESPRALRSTVLFADETNTAQYSGKFEHSCGNAKIEKDKGLNKQLC